MNLIDCHTHTQFSMDSEADINECIRKAIDIGLSAYAVTDHCECSTWYTENHYSDKENFDYFNYAQDFYNSVSAVTELKEKYKNFNLICGVEMGQATQDIEVAEKIISDERLDFIIGSMHQLKGEKDFYYIDYENMSMDEIYNLLERYFKEVYQLCKMDCFDVLGHLTYCMRYMKCRNGINPNISRFDEIIAESFRILAQNGKGIEINTSGIRQGFGDVFPSLKYVKLFRDMGGEILSIGSDSHYVDDIGKNVADGVETAKAAGFTRLCYFKKRKPYFINID
ncbi:MAG: histidinol-phosphatase HisJ family protein [Ruminococcus sp.]|nr:histidinol-phosphatase HisJ family protein [Ruminococcus sp.]